ncbi:hypothetical protein A3K34_02480 [candidate division WWE3 bacterium RIFOXYC1_FULL_40_10]|uniref:Uncharacterized protein n=1 Tax=candidate division WWE3 bacterium RIFOXYA2_FULL_46_9 TaxID=1802636 RepID=A0A1F4W2T5_UNCKA|nr:MAG: hypothetical protein A3K58_02480 [candidate division WWE3 bacterium RIFOXYB1_FULL_40_22]OGC61717.1 MAG: hypothetical protein A3K37_02480 [candidate division WWE3 bacterium RIFOXYA1_FULL_40_11]OGC63701.1 MAG: hypothetical protein A2264_04970 [candidate division WWE3 bacterium RIFOXYA2_FULL_46_9]OGC64891.1 MAG: hypothetical protein A2326_01305 [candidate division WWE3 bacterium RIFOXYB2_FULL_41_6]OGC66100.1 MAG: hypothetical protein A3K34_02480 [candidate division WWE3 bacterium RIFOXYC1_
MGKAPIIKIDDRIMWLAVPVMFFVFVIFLADQVFRGFTGKSLGEMPALVQATVHLITLALAYKIVRMIVH